MEGPHPTSSKLVVHQGLASQFNQMSGGIRRPQDLQFPMYTVPCEKVLLMKKLRMHEDLMDTWQILGRGPLNAGLSFSFV